MLKPKLKMILVIILVSLLTSSGFSANITIDWDNGNTQEITLVNDAVFSFSNGKSGATYKLIIKQNGSGTGTVTWPSSNIKWYDGAPTISTTSGAIDVVTFLYNGADYLGNFHKGFHDGTGVYGGTGWVDDSTVVRLSTSTDKVGIGTATPQDKLEVEGGHITIDRSAGNYRQIKYTADNILRWAIGTDNSTESGSNVGADLNIWKYADDGASLGSALKIIRSTGNIGIATVNPEAPLTFQGIPGDKINFYSTNNNWKMQMGIERYGTDYNMRFGMPNYTGRIFQFGTISTSDGTTYNPLITVLGNGNVGIGTATPSQKLEIGPSASGGAGLKFDTNSSYGPYIRTVSGSNMGILYIDPASYIMRMYNGSNAMSFDIYNVETQAVLLNSNGNSWLNGGNVGIGTTSPGSYKLNVNGDFNATRIFKNGSEVTCSPYTNVWSTGTGSDIYRASGNIGIGTTTPEAHFEIERSDATIFNDTAEQLPTPVGTTLFIQNTDATTNSFAQLVFGTRVSGVGVNRIVSINKGANTADLAFTTENGGTHSAKMYIQANGNIGIGTTTPNQLLEVKGTNPQVRLTAGTTTDWAGMVWWAGTDDRWFIGQGDDGKFIIRDLTTATHANRLVVESGGNIGIGTATPSGKFDVRTSTTNSQIYFTEYTAGNTVARPSIRINNVGTPTGSWDGSSGVWFDDDGTNKAIVGWINSDATSFAASRKGTLELWTAGTPGDIIFEPAQNEVMRITTTGNVGIGTTNPTQKLYVVGNIYATGSITPGSSRELKENISNLTTKEALSTLRELQPIKFNYKADKEKELQIGFIAEDVPDLVSTSDRKGVNPMDIVAVLTKVVQEQQKEINELKALIQKEK